MTSVQDGLEYGLEEAFDHSALNTTMTRAEVEGAYTRKLMGWCPRKCRRMPYKEVLLGPRQSQPSAHSRKKDIGPTAA